MDKQDSKERKHHETLSPSTFPMLKECPKFKNREGTSEAATRGVLFHDQLQELIDKWQSK